MALARQFVAASVIILLGIARPCSGNAFLQRFDVMALASQEDLLNESVVEKSLLEEIRGYIGKGVQDRHLREVQEFLAPMWSALPKNEQGNLDGRSARYALHRFFVQRHGWYIRGLESVASNTASSLTGAVDSASSAGVLKDRVPGFLLEVFKKALSGSGFRLDSLVVLASTIERLIHDEAIERLANVYRALELPTGPADLVKPVDADNALRTYMIALIGGSSVPPLHNLTAKRAHRLVQRFGKAYPAWEDTQVWLSDVRETVSFMDRDRSNPFRHSSGFRVNEVLRVAEEASDRFGRFQDRECRHLKDSLLEVEEGSSGRVRLSDFYKKALDFSNGAYFSEPVDYLREQRTLDETRPGEPRVLVANYILARGNCLGETGFYTICCINECDTLMAHIERVVAAPRAPPGLLADLVANLSSSTVEAPRELSDVMLRRLNGIAARSGGEVLLHGRLFSQWLHFAFPRECPYPNGAPEELAPRANKSSTVQSLASIQEYVEAVQVRTPGDDSADLEAYAVLSHEEEEEMLFSEGGPQVPVNGFFGCIIASLSDAVGALMPASMRHALLLPVVALLGVAEAKRRLVDADQPTPPATVRQPDKPQFV